MEIISSPQNQGFEQHRHNKHWKPHNSPDHNYNYKLETAQSDPPPVKSTHPNQVGDPKTSPSPLREQAKA